MNYEKLTPTMKRILALAEIECEKRDSFIGVDSVLAAMMLEGDNYANTVLTDAGFTVDCFRKGERVKPPTPTGTIIETTNVRFHFSVQPHDCLDAFLFIGTINTKKEGWDAPEQYVWLGENMYSDRDAAAMALLKKAVKVIVKPKFD